MRYVIAMMLTVLVTAIAGCGGPGYVGEFIPSERADGASVSTATFDQSNNESGENLLDTRKIISSATIRIKTLTPDSVHLAVIAMATEYGGYVLESGDGETTIRIPASRYHAALTKVESLGEVISREIEGRDVTEEYYDLQTRLDNAEKTRLRYLELLNEAKGLDQILRVERELGRINALIEDLKGKIERLSHQVAHATITVRTTEGVKAGPVAWAFEQMFSGVKWLFVRE